VQRPTLSLARAGASVALFLVAQLDSAPLQ
jgi:hypothetical protein